MNKDFKINLKEHLKETLNSELDPISIFFEKNIGNIINMDTIVLSAKNNIFLKSCEIKNQPYKLIFTVGICTIANLELYFCLPKEWEIKRYFSSPYIEETLPVDLLREIVVKLERKNSKYIIEEGLFISKFTPPFNKFNWDENVDGFLLIDHQWKNSKQENKDDNDETITLFALLPILHSSKKINNAKIREYIEDYKNSNWDKICLPLNPYIKLQKDLNDAISNYSMEKVKNAIKKGAKVDRGYINNHWQFGFFTQESLLQKSFESKNEELIRYLVDSGAIVPIDAIATIGGWGTESIFKYLLEKGSDINAESVNMTALMRAEAFKNQQGINDLIKLGAVR